jgi:hypothetical protein
VEVNERDLALHREPQADVLIVLRIGPSVSIPKQAVFAEGVIVRAGLPFDHRDGRDAEWDVGQHTRLEDALWAHERHALAFVDEPADEKLPWEDTFVTCEPPLLFEESERGQSDLGVIHHRIAAVF